MPNKELEEQINKYEQEQKSGKKKKKSPWKYVLNISLVLIATGISTFFALKDDFDAVTTIIKTAELKYIFIIIGLMFFITLIRSFILFCFARLYTRDYHIHHAMAVDQIGIFYNAVTPGSYGGQFMQAYTYKKQGVQISAAVSILAMYSIVFQIVLIIFGALSFIFKYDFITSLGKIGPFTIMEVKFSIPIWPLTIIGFLLNVSVILLVLLMGYWHRFHNFIMGPVVNLLTKIKILKHPDKTRENLRMQVENFKIEFSRLLTNVPFFILVSVLFVFYFLTKFSIPYFCGLALDPLVEPSWSNFFDSIFLSNYHQMVTGLIPLPGSAGASELFYSQLFDGYFSDFSYCKASLLLWRSMTFVIPLLFAGFVTAFYKASPRDEIEEAEKFPNRETFVALQNETIVERTNELNTLIETTQLSRQAIMAKLKASTNKIKKNKNDDSILNKDYDDIEIDDEEEK